MLKKTILAATILALSGCSQQSFIINNNIDENSISDTMQPFFISGFGQNQKISATEECGDSNKVAMVETQQTAVDVILNNFSYGIFSPRHARVYCTYTH